MSFWLPRIWRFSLWAVGSFVAIHFIVKYW